MVLSLLLAIILFVCFAMLIREGLWNNVLTAVNALFAGLIASSLWEPLATWLEGFVPSGTYLWDFISLWLIFCVAFVVLRTLTDLISRTRVRFKKPVDSAGGILFSLWVGWVMVSFAAMTIAVHDASQLARILSRLQGLKGILRVERRGQASMSS